MEDSYDYDTMGVFEVITVPQVFFPTPKPGLRGLNILRDNHA